MSNIQNVDLTDSLEEGFAAAPIAASENSAAVQLCVVVRREADPASGNFVLLRRFLGGTVLLGCFRDRGGRICEWVELWVQTPDGNSDSIHFSNAALDEDWEMTANALRACDPASHFTTVEEREPTPPTFIDLNNLSPWHPAHEGQILKVCLDDAVLEHRSLPKYALSSSRYGWVPSLGANGPLVPLTPNSPPADLPPPEPAGIVPFNRAGGRMIVRAFGPLTFEDYAGVLAGQPWAGPGNGRRPCRLNGPYRLLGDEDQLRCAGRHYQSSRQGVAGRIVETLHLKLLLATECMRLVRDYVHRTQLPMLNLTGDSFRVRLGTTSPELPLLWTAKPLLVEPGNSVALPIPNAQARYFQHREPMRESIYRPEELTRIRRGSAKVRIRKVYPPVQEGIVIEATLATQEAVTPERHELLRLAIPLVSGTVTLFGYLDPQVTMAQGEIGFRSLPMQLTESETAGLNEAAGVIFTQVPAEIQAPLSTPCDLYSLGVLAVHALFCGNKLTLPAAKDNLFSLSAAVAGAPSGTEDLAAAIAAVFESDNRWLDAIGPQFLVSEELSSQQAAELIPIALWSKVLATLLRLFPSRSPFAFCQDFADAPPLALHSAFDRPLRELERTLRITRSMHLMDWTQNREIATSINGWIENS